MQTKITHTNWKLHGRLASLTQSKSNPRDVYAFTSLTHKCYTIEISIYSAYFVDCTLQLWLASVCILWWQWYHIHVRAHSYCTPMLANKDADLAELLEMSMLFFNQFFSVLLETKKMKSKVQRVYVCLIENPLLVRHLVKRPFGMIIIICSAIPLEWNCIKYNIYATEKTSDNNRLA